MFHRLRVLNFSQSFLSDCTNRSKPKKEIETETDEIPKRKVSSILKITTNQNNNRTKQTNHDEVPVSSKEIRKRQCVTYNDVEEDNSEWEPPSPMFQRNFTKPKKSLSATLTCSSKKYIFNSLSHRKTMSLIDVKKRMTTKRHKYCKTIKLAFQSLKKDVAVKKPPKVMKRQAQDMKLVFVCSSRNPLQAKTAGTVTCSNSLTYRRRQRRADASTSYSDIFGFRNKKKVFNRYSYQRTNYDDSFFQKLKRRSDTKRKNINGYFRKCSRIMNNVGAVSTGLGHDSSYRSKRLHYNLVDFPRCANIKRRSKESTRPTKNKLKVMNDSNVLCSRCCNAPLRECKHTSVSCTNLRLICKDVACGTNRSVLFDKPSPKPSGSCSRLGRPTFTRQRSCGPQSTKPKCRKCFKKNVSFKKKRKSVLNEASFIKSSVFHKFQGYSEKFYHRRDIQGKTVLKYVILAIVAVAWSPCLLAIACGWLLTYPLRPHQIIAQNGIGKCQKVCSSYYNNNSNSFWALMVGNMKNAFHKTISTGSAIKSMLVPDIDHKAKSLQINSSPTLINSGPTELPKHPNPQRRYTLCYDAVRGWVMKPVRQRKRSRARISVVSHVIQKYLSGCGFTSNNTRHGVCTYNVTAGTKPKYDYHGPSVSDPLKSTKSSITYKQPVTAKSKHCEPQDKCLYSNPFKKKTHTDAQRKCICHKHYNKTYTDKKTGDENISYKLSSKIPKETGTQDHDTARLKRNPLASPKKIEIGPTDRQHRPVTQKSILSRRSTIDEKELYPSSICRKCGQRHSGIELETSSICKECFKPHSRHIPQSLRKHSASHIYHQQDNRDTNVLLPRRGQRRGTVSENSSAFVLKPKRSMSEMSILHAYRELLAYNLPKRSLSESSRGLCCTCKSPLSRCKKGGIGRRYSEYLERRASEIVGPQMKRPSISSKERSASQFGGPEQKRSRISFKEQVGGPGKKRSRGSIKERKGYQIGGPEQKRSRSPIKERKGYHIGGPEQKRSSILVKKQSLKKHLTRSPANERFDIKVKRKKKKKKIPESETKFKKRTLFTKPIILIQKIVPITRKRGKKFYKYCGGKWLNRCDKKCRDGIWPMHLECRHLYLYTMKKRPCFWVYGMCPNCYPSFLGFHSCCRGCFQACIFTLSLILWSPVLLCLYICYLCACESCCN